MATGNCVFVLDMGRPVTIMDLAKRTINLSGLNVRESISDVGIEIRIMARWPAEKLYRRVLIGEDPPHT